MRFELIDMKTWSRKEYFDHYFNKVNCSYSLTTNLDITRLHRLLKAKGLKLYPVLIYLTTFVVNKHTEFRTALNEEGKLGVFESMSPCYTVFQPESETFTSVWTPYDPDFPVFYQECLNDIKAYGQSKNFMAKPNAPDNLVNFSSIPWVTFTGFNLNLPRATNYLLPIFTTGKYVTQNDQLLLPIAIQVHHAVCDGYHVARFVNELQEAIHQFEI